MALSFQEPVAAVCMLPNSNNYIASNLALFKFFNILYSCSLGFLYCNVLKEQEVCEI